jgi:hypothetical protein
MPEIGLPARPDVLWLPQAREYEEQRGDADYAAAIRIAFDQGGELSATVELRRLFPGITDCDQARAFARIIAGWQPLPMKSRRPAGSPARIAARARK